MTEVLQIISNDNPTDVLQAIRDSISVMAPHIQQLADNSNPEPYTIQSIDLAKNNLGIAIIALVGVIAGILGAIFGYRGYKYSKETASNVARISIDTQITLYKDFIKDLYRNAVTVIRIMKTNQDRGPILPDSIISLYVADFNDIFHTEAYNRNKDIYLEMKYIKDRMRNYNNMVNLCYKHSEGGFVSSDELANLLYRSIHILTLVRLASIHLSPMQNRSETFIFIFNDLHVKHVMNNSSYIISKWQDSSFSKQIVQNSLCFLDNNKFLDKLYSLIGDEEVVNPSIRNLEYRDIVAQSTDNDYNSLVLKDKWNVDDMKKLLVKILSYDSLISGR